MKIVVDGFGGDFAPNAVVEGAMLALEKQKDLSIIITGDKNIIKPLINKDFGERLTIAHSTQVIQNDEAPTEAIRGKDDSSMVVAYNILKNDEQVGALVSGGSTGALLAGAIFKLGRLKGISRPALAPIMPTMTGGQFMLIDCGANADCKPINILHFAMMADSYLKAVLKNNNPRIALLSNGTEEGKGSALVQESYKLLKESGLNFVGNIEARDMLRGDIDAVVTDGFSGNIALKTIEGTVNCVFEFMKQEIKGGNLKTKIGALLFKPALRNLKNKVDYNKVGGAVLLGAEKPIVKAHGTSRGEAFSNAILQAYKTADGNVTGLLKHQLEKEKTDEN